MPQQTVPASPPSCAQQKAADAARQRLFAVLGVTLAAVGVYGVMAFTVSRRTRELGIRVALGADPSALLTLVLDRSLLMAAAGVLAGLAAGLGTSLLLRTMFHGVQILDPLVLATVSALVISVSLLASNVPARRAMRIDPLEALRVDRVSVGHRGGLASKLGAPWPNRS